MVSQSLNLTTAQNTEYYFFISIGAYSENPIESLYCCRDQRNILELRNANYKKFVMAIINEFCIEAY